MRGIFIVLEGPDGSGKSTMAKKIGELFTKSGRNVRFTREPGGTNIGEDIRNIILDKKNVEIDYRTEALLYAASRAQLVSEKINPWLENKDIVISERFLLSSLIYQGIGRGLGVDEIEKINRFAIAGINPDITILLSVDPEKALKRKLAIDGGDRLENEKISFHQKVFSGYLELSKNYENIIIIDADRTVEEIFSEIEIILKKYI